MPRRSLTVAAKVLVLGSFLILARGLDARQQGAAPVPGVARVEALLAGGNAPITVSEYSKKSENLPTGFAIAAEEIAKCNQGKTDGCAQLGDAFGKVKAKSGEPAWLAAPAAAGAKAGCRVGKPEICERLIKYAELFWARACVLDSTRCALLGKELEARGEVAGARYLYEATHNDLELARSYESAEPRDPEQAAYLFGSLCVTDEVEAACRHLIETGKGDAQIEDTLVAIYQKECSGSADWRIVEQSCQALLEKRPDDDGARQNLKAAKQAELAQRKQDLEEQIQNELAAAVSDEQNANNQYIIASKQQNQTNAAVYQSGAEADQKNANEHRKKAERLQKELNELMRAANAR